MIDDPSRLVIAYEPIWAIGTGRTAIAADISDLIARVIRPVLAGLWGEEAADQIRILYGGSVKPVNAATLFNQSEIDGALIGGASLNAEDSHERAFYRSPGGRELTHGSGMGAGVGRPHSHVGLGA